MRRTGVMLLGVMLGACASAPAVSTGEGLPVEDREAIKVLTGVDYPAFAQSMAAYCRKHLPTESSFVEEVDGFVDLACQPRTLGMCLRAVTFSGYRFVEFEAPRYAKRGRPPAGKYRVRVYEAGDPACASPVPFEMPPAKEGVCYGVEGIDAFSADYAVASINDTRGAGPLIVERLGAQIVDRRTGETVAQSMTVTVDSTEAGGWRLSCAHSPGAPLEAVVIPPRR